MQVVIERGITSPDLILNKVREEIIKALNPEGSILESKDGMDCVLCCFDFTTMQLQYAAANNSFYIMREVENNSEQQELIECKADKMPVGIHHGALTQVA